MGKPTADEILQSTKEFLATQGFGADEVNETDRIEKLLEVLGKSRNTQSTFYGWQPPQGGGVLRKAKNFIQLKFKAIILNTLEKYVMRQQKFNEVAYQTILELHAENLRLKEKLHGTNN